MLASKIPANGYNQAMERERFVTIEEVMEFLSVKRSTVYKWTHTEFIPHYKLKREIRFKLSEIENWMKRRQVKGRDTYQIKLEI